ATAQELADDLRRFLEEKPIAAKPPAVLERARKWARRHRPLVRALVAALLIAVAALTASTAWAFHMNSQTEEALADTVVKQKEAEQARADEKWQREQAEKNAKALREALQQAEREKKR